MCLVLTLVVGAMLLGSDESGRYGGRLAFEKDDALNFDCFTTSYIDTSYTTILCDSTLI